MIELPLTSADDNIQYLKNIVYTYYNSKSILAQLTIVQAILEGGLEHNPPSELAYKYNNLFGIKGSGTDGSVKLPSKEYTDGNLETSIETFAANVTLMDSIKQHDHILQLDRYSSVRSADTFEMAAEQVRIDGYATDPRYSQELIGVYNEYIKNDL